MADSGNGLLERARALHAESLVFDGHADTPQRFADDGWHWTASDLGMGQLSAETAREGGLSGGFLVAWAQPDEWHGQFPDRTFALIDSIQTQAQRSPHTLAVCRSADEVQAARADGRFAAMIAVEGGHSIDNSIDTLRAFYGRGARLMTLTWANANDWCGSSGDGENARGLSAFGFEVVQEMNRLGMAVDLAHVSDAAFWDALKASRAPVMVSHSSARALCGAARNLTDDMARAVAEKGGVVMINFFAAFLSDAWREAWNGQRPERDAAVEHVRRYYRSREQPMPFFAGLAVEREYARLIPPVPFSVLVDHFEHLLRVCGTEHVGIGSDFDGIPLSVQGMDSAADLPKITAGLLERGWAESDLRGMLGENAMRVLRAVQRAAATS